MVFGDFIYFIGLLGYLFSELVNKKIVEIKCERHYFTRYNAPHI